MISSCSSLLGALGPNPPKKDNFSLVRWLRHSGHRARIWGTDRASKPRTEPLHFPSPLAPSESAKVERGYARCLLFIESLLNICLNISSSCCSVIAGNLVIVGTLPWTIRQSVHCTVSVELVSAPRCTSSAAVTARAERIRWISSHQSTIFSATH